MSLYDITIFIAAALIFITALARLNDIKRSQNSLRWWARRVGWLMVIVGSGMLMAQFFTAASAHWFQIMRFCFLWGVVIVWMTTPNMPPWHRFIARFDPKEPSP